MTHVVTDKCIKCKYTDCVAVCPVNCFRKAKNMLVIDPNICIDCGVCVEECPIRAIKPDYEAEGKWAEINRKYSALFPIIKTVESPLPSAEEFKNQEGKEKFLYENEEDQEKNK